MFLAISVILFWGHATATSAQCDQLVAVTECVCPGQTVVYRCSVMGGIFTVYDGTAFECSLGEITLSNNEFGTANNPIQRCSSQQISITGVGLSNLNSCFTSQINVSLSDSGGAGRTISCGVDDGSGPVMPIGTTTLDISTEGFAPPSNVSLTAVSPSYITFSWNPVLRNCPSLHYSVTSQGCGTCESETDATSINCTHFSEALYQEGALECELSVQTVICGGTSAAVGGNLSSVLVALKVPSPPNLSIIPYYSGDGQLKGFDANITLTDPMPVQISDSFDGAAKSINFTFLNDRNEMCRVDTKILVSNSCVGVICSHYSSEICSDSSTETGVIVQASNILGSGMLSSTTIISNMNDFVKIKFIPPLSTNTRIVECIFQDPQDGRNMCEISIGKGGTFVKKTGQTLSKSIVQINVDDILEGLKELSYNITASDGTGRVVIVQEVRSLSSTVNTEEIAGGTVVAIVVIILVPVAVVIPVIYIWYCERQVQKKGFVEANRNETEADPDLGKRYRKTESNEALPPIGKLVAEREKDGQWFGLDSADIVRRFVDDRRQVLPVNQRKRSYRGYSLYIQTLSGPYDSTNSLNIDNPAKNNLLSQITSEPKLPDGVQRLDHWFKLVEVQRACPLPDVCRDHFNRLNVHTAQNDGTLFYSDKTRTLPRLTDLGQSLVMAVDYNTHLYADGKKKLASDLLAGKELKGWKGVFIQAKNDANRYMSEGSMVLLVDPNLKRVLISKKFELYKTSSKKENLEFIRDQTPDDPCLLDDIYREVQEIKRSDLKHVALCEDGKLYDARNSTFEQLRERGCTHVFLQVEKDESVEANTQLLYVPSQ